MKVALIAGGTRGLGLAIAHQLARDGFNLILGYNSNHDAAKLAKQELETYNIKVVTIAGDIKKPHTVDAFFKAVEEEFDNQLTAFIQIAGYLIAAKLPGEFTFGQYDEAQELYPKVFLRCMEKALSYMINGEGRIVVMSGHGVHDPGNIYAMLAPAKAALEVLAKHYALALAPRGITVNIVAPGYIKTQAWDGVLKIVPYIDKLPGKATPMGRWGQPNDVAPLVAFLCSEPSRFITGQHIYVDGGVGLSLFWNIHQISENLKPD